MLAVTAVMYTVSSIHWAVNMVVAAKSLRADALMITPFELLVTSYLPLINVRYLEAASLAANAHFGEVHFERRDRCVASLGVVGSESQICPIHSPDLIPRVHARSAFADCGVVLSVDGSIFQLWRPLALHSCTSVPSMSPSEKVS